MRKDPKNFRERFKHWKETGEYLLPGSTLPDTSSVESSIPYPMLTSRDYDDARAYLLGYFDEAGATGHLWSNDRETGRILKSPTHPTISKAIWGDKSQGYDVINNNGLYYSKPSFIKQKIDKLPGYDDGKDGFTKTYVNQWGVDEEGNVRTPDGRIQNAAVVLDDIYVTPKGNYLNPPKKRDYSYTAGDSYYHPEDMFSYANALTGGFMLNLSPTQWLRRGYDAVTGNLTADSWFEGNAGLVSDEWEQKHPYLSMGVNALIDGLVLGGSSAIKLVKLIPSYKALLKPTLNSGSIDYSLPGVNIVNKFRSILARNFLIGNTSDGLLGRIPSSWERRVHTSYPSEVEKTLHSLVLPRMIRNRNYVAGFSETKFKNQFRTIADGEWTSGSASAFLAYDAENPLFRTGGFYDPATNKIVMRAGQNPLDVLVHEIRHKLNEGIPLTRYEENLLKVAYDHDFINLSKTDPAFKGLDLSAERVTTNLDARQFLLGPAGRNMPLWLLDAIIRNAKMHEIIEAVENSNGYGKAYIDALKASGRFNTEIKDISDRFRRAMMYVGSASVPVGLSIPTLNNK